MPRSHHSLYVDSMGYLWMAFYYAVPIINQEICSRVTSVLALIQEWNLEQPSGIILSADVNQHSSVTGNIVLVIDTSWNLGRVAFNQSPSFLCCRRLCQAQQHFPHLIRGAFHVHINIPGILDARVPAAQKCVEIVRINGACLPQYQHIHLHAMGSIWLILLVSMSPWRNTIQSILPAVVILGQPLHACHPYRPIHWRKSDCPGRPSDRAASAGRFGALLRMADFDWRVAWRRMAMNEWVKQPNIAFMISAWNDDRPYHAEMVNLWEEFLWPWLLR